LITGSRYLSNRAIIKMANYVFFMLAQLLASCTNEQVYGVGQAWQRNECFKINDSQERSRCLETANTPYSQYKAKSEVSP
jgi:hypothetical protein